MTGSSQYDPAEYFRNLRPAASGDSQTATAAEEPPQTSRSRKNDSRSIISRSNYALVPLPRSHNNGRSAASGGDSDDYEELMLGGGSGWPMMGPAMMNPGTALVAGLMGAPKSKLQLAAVVVAVLGCGAMMSGIAGLGLVVLLLAAGLLTGGALVVILVCCAMIAAVVTGVPVGYVVWKVAKDRWLEADD